MDFILNRSGYDLPVIAKIFGFGCVILFCFVFQLAKHQYEEQISKLLMEKQELAWKSVCRKDLFL